VEPAPLHAEIAEGPPGGAAHWIRAEDGVRLRLGHWPAAGRACGSVLLIPGRGEYVEKYGRTAADLAAAGYATAVIDLRGQGLADRPLADPMIGHVADFAHYQRDVRAMLAAARALGLPEPLHLLSHSMGGCIALRALVEGLPVVSAAFSAPMLGIVVTPALRPFARLVAGAAGPLGIAGRPVPGAGPAPHVQVTPFAENRLTRDPDQYAYMQRQTAAHPELALGPPSLGWVNAALVEMRRLARIAPPRLPAYGALGSREAIVAAAPVRRLFDRWPGARLEIYEGAEHEVLMERAHHRRRFLDAVLALFAAAAAPS
jgi:lysophospholipase